jgi:hypothetical protein
LPIRLFSPDVVKNLSFGTPRYPLVELVQYELGEPHKVHLDPFPQWKINHTALRNNQINLHIFAQPAEEHVGHPQEAFNDLVAMFPGTKLELEPGFHDEPYDPSLASMGFDPVQQMSLSERGGLTPEQQRQRVTAAKIEKPEPDSGSTGANCFASLLVIPASTPSSGCNV